MFFVASSAKVRNLTANPRLALVVVDDRTYHAPGVPAYAQITGRAILKPGEPEMPDRLARAYGQAGGYIGRLPEFCTVLMTVDRVSGLGPVHGGTMGGWGPPPD